MSLHLDPLTADSFQAWVDGDDLVFTIHPTIDGWKTEGHPTFDGLLFESQDALVARIEGADQ